MHAWGQIAPAGEGVAVTLFEIVLLAVAGFVAGGINAVAGGGTFVSFAALVACGLTTLDANATSAVALTPSALASIAAYRDEVRRNTRSFIPFAVVGVIGGALGALLLIWIGDAGFRPLVPWLLLMATLLFAFSERIRIFAESRASPGRKAGTHIAAYVLMGVVAVYGGFFGAGIGIVMLAALSILGGGDYHKANAMKISLAFLIQLFAAILLIIGGLVHWPEAIVTMAAASAGGYLGVGWARRLPEHVTRAVVVTIGAVLTLIFFIRT